MSKLYVYKGKLWKEIKHFLYTGEKQQFHLDKGNYFVLCDGAHGSFGARTLLTRPWGGRAMGILNLKKDSDMYAFVGGDGEHSDTTTNATGKGGWNGGADGGESYSSLYSRGHGGGGATDIRLKCPEDFEDDLLICKSKYIRLRIGANRSNNDYFQMTGWNFYDAGGSVIPVENIYASISDDEIVTPEYSSGGDLEHLVDGLTTTTYCSKKANRNASFINIYFEFDKEYSIASYSYITGKDYQERDPISWRIYSSDDNENWTLVDRRIRITSSIPTTRITETIKFEKQPHTHEDDLFPDIILPGEYEQIRYISVSNNKGGFYTNYYPTNITDVEFIGMSIPETSNYECLFGCRYGNGDRNFGFGVCWVGRKNAVWMINDKEIAHPTETFVYNELGRVRTFGNKVEWYKGPNLDEKIGEIDATPTERSSDDFYNLAIMGMASNGSTLNSSLASNGRCYSVKIFENDVLVRHYVPVVRYDGTIGLYDRFSNNFITGSNGTYSSSLTEPIKTIIDPSLYSRIIVGSGGGGGTNMGLTGNINNIDYMGVGGGIVGSMAGGATSTGNTNTLTPNQNSGYSFGKGQTPIKKTANNNYNGEGASGGGGGWFGGYANTTVGRTAYTSAAGGGGSSYILTEDSWKPDDYMVDDNYYFTEPTLMTGASEISQIIIAEETNVVSSGDEIYAFCIGDLDHFTAINDMKLTIECFGAHGGFRDNIQMAGKGGYAKGTVNIKTGDKIYVAVGDNGFGYNLGDTAFNMNFRPTLSFNGGGCNVRNWDSFINAAPGGGATDVRICPAKRIKPPTGQFKYAKIEFLERKEEHIISEKSQRGLQMTNFGFNDNNGEINVIKIDGFPNLDLSGNLRYNSDQERVEKLIDGNMDTKFNCFWDGCVVVLMEFENLVDDIESYFITSANDAIWRDPYFWKVYVSKDGSDWQLLDIRYNVLSDVRLEKYTFTKEEFSLRDQPSLNNRLIVAGGGGGTGYYTYKAGDGGGLTGGASQNNGSADQNAGPGTQTSAPTINTYVQYGVDGDFGVGGMGYTGRGGAGGGGGGGWFGGSGIYPNNRNDDDKSGNGGSGYVLTENSYKKPGYQLSEDYYMTDTELVTGGNNLQINQQMIKITVNESAPLKILAKDLKGIKYFDEELSKWNYLGKEYPTKETFEEYGTDSFISDIGLEDRYEIITRPLFDTVDDKMINVQSSKFNVIPPKQRISYISKAKINPQAYTIDAEYNKSNTKLELTSKRTGVGEDAKLQVDLIVNLTNEKSIPYIYSVYMDTVLSGTGNRYIPPSDPTPKPPVPKPGDDDYVEKDLLPVGRRDGIPKTYYQYLDNAVTDISSAVSKIYNRELYIFLSINNKSTYRFVKISLTTHRVTLIKDFPSTSFAFNDNGRTIGNFEIFDDRYVVITSGCQNTFSFWYRYDMQTDTLLMYNINVIDYRLTAYGKIQRLSDNTIMLIGRTGYIQYNVREHTVVLSGTGKLTSRNYSDFTYGKKHYCLSYNGNILTFIDAETGVVTSKTLNVSSMTSVCYLNGKFYVVQNGLLYIIDDETLSVERTDIVPWTNICTVNISRGIVYCTQNNSSRLWVYSLKDKIYDSTFLTWIPPAWGDYYPFRPSTLNGTIYFPYWNLVELSFIEAAKYNLGKKYGQYYISYTKEFENDFTFDERFVKFYDSHMEVKTGDIIYDGEKPVDTDDKLIRSFKIEKSDYYKILNVGFNITLINPDNQEESEDLG